MSEFLKFNVYLQLCYLIITNIFFNVSSGLQMESYLFNTQIFQWDLTFSTYPFNLLRIESPSFTQTDFIKICSFCGKPVLLNQCTRNICDHIKIAYKHFYLTECKGGKIINTSLNLVNPTSVFSCESVFSEIECENCTDCEVSDLYSSNNLLSTKLAPSGYIPQSITDLEGLLIPVAVLDYIPFFIVHSSTTDGYDGVEYRMIEEMARQLNFTPQYHIYESWVNMLENDTWHGGLGGAMQEGITDLAFGNIWQIPSLGKIMEFGPSFATTKLTFLVRRPQKKVIGWNTILNIFEPKVWAATILGFFMVTTAYKVGSQLDPKKYHSVGWGTGTLYILGRLTTSSFHSTVDTLAIRIIHTSWSLFCLLISSAFFSSILLRFSLPLYEARVDTIKHLVEGDYYWSAQWYKRFRVNLEFKESMFNLKNYWENRFEKKYRYIEPEEVEKAVKFDEKITFSALLYAGDMVRIESGIEWLGTELGLDKNTEVLRNFRICKEGTMTHHVSFGVKKCSSLLEPLTLLANHFSEAGLLHYWKRSVIRRTPEYESRQFLVERDTATFSEPQQLHLHNLRPLFFLLLFGLFLASLAFIIEIFWYRYRKNKH